MKDPELVEAFLAEAGEHLATVEEDILALEAGPTGPETINRLFRSLHTIKGASALLALGKVTRLSHLLEDVLGRIRAGTLIPREAVIEAILSGVDKLKLLLDDLEDDSVSVDSEVESLRQFVNGGPTRSNLSEAPPSSQAASSPTELMENRQGLRSGAEMEAPKPDAPSPHERPVTSVSAPSRPAVIDYRTDLDIIRKSVPFDSSVRIPLSLLDKLMNLATELVLVRNQNSQAVEAGNLDGLAAIAQRLNVVTSELQASIMQTRMRPVGLVFSKFNRFVRDTARRLGKEVDLEIIGSDVELDKNIIEAINDPLTHLIRNAVDHGLESPNERQAKGKTPRGNIRLSAFHQAGLVNIRITDDGHGMDPAALKKAAVDRGAISAEQAAEMQDRDALNLIFTPGFSMADAVTDMSGRGVGMDVVRDSLKKLGGVIDIDTALNVGTTITIKLPLTLAILPALIVSVEQMCFAIPQINIREVVWLHGSEVFQSINQVDDREVYWLRDKLLPLLRLSRLLDIEGTFVDPNTRVRQRDRRSWTPDRRSRDAEEELAERRKGPAERRTSIENEVTIVVLKLGDEEFGLLVDRVIDTEEIVVTALHDQLKSCGAFAGTTVLGDGRIAMILDVSGLVELGALRLGNPEVAVSHQVDSSDDRQPVLLFNLGGDESFAVPLYLITRVEQISPHKIQRANKREYIALGHDVVPLVRLDLLEPSFSSAYGEDIAYVIIPRNRKAIGVLVADILDTKDVDVDIDTETIVRSGVVGSALVDDRLTLFLDLYEFVSRVEREWYGDSLADRERTSTVLLVEDSAFYASLIIPRLRSAGVEVVHAINGEEGLKALEEHQFDMVISDIEMPVMGGLELARRVRGAGIHGDLPMLAISTINDESMASSALTAGFDWFQSKLDQEMLLNRVVSLGTSKTLDGGGEE